MKETITEVRSKKSLVKEIKNILEKNNYTKSNEFGYAYISQDKINTIEFADIRSDFAVIYIMRKNILDWREYKSFIWYFKKTNFDDFYDMYITPEIKYN